MCDLSIAPPIEMVDAVKYKGRNKTCENKFCFTLLDVFRWLFLVLHSDEQKVLSSLSYLIYGSTLFTIFLIASLFDRGTVSMMWLRSSFIMTSRAPEEISGVLPNRI